MSNVQPKISYAELEDKLANPDIPDAEIRPYLSGDKENSRPFAPVLVPNPDRVMLDPMDQFRVRAAGGMRWANNISMWRRQERFKLRRDRGEQQPIIASEGDSWSQFPFLLDDVFDQIEPGYLTWCVAAAGDTLQNMIIDKPHFIKAIQEGGAGVRALLFSGAGNDYMGTDLDGVAWLSKVLRQFEPNRSIAWFLETPEFDARLSFVRSSYVTLLTTVEVAFPSLPVVLHGYDYAIPYRGDHRNPIYADRDQWLARPLRENGIVDPILQAAIVKEMVDRLNTALQSLCGGNVLGGAFANAHHVDLRGTLPDVADWADELHPSDAGFARVAQKIRAVLDPLVGP